MCEAERGHEWFARSSCAGCDVALCVVSMLPCMMDDGPLMDRVVMTKDFAISLDCVLNV